MEKIVVLFSGYEAKKHSLRYNSVSKEDAIMSVYVMKHSLQTPYPKKIKITIEEVEG
jgi:hypothetical protein